MQPQIFLPKLNILSYCGLLVFFASFSSTIRFLFLSPSHPKSSWQAVTHFNAATGGPKPLVRLFHRFLRQQQFRPMNSIARLRSERNYADGQRGSLWRSSHEATAGHRKRMPPLTTQDASRSLVEEQKDRFPLFLSLSLSSSSSSSATF